MVREWLEKPIGELFEISGGLSASRAQLSDRGYPYLHYGDIHGSSRTFVDVCIDRTIPCLDVPLTRVSKASLLQDGDVIFVDASEDDEGASRHIVVRNVENRPFISGLHTIVAKAKTDELDNRFREFCFQTVAVKAQFKFYAAGTKVVGVSKTNIKDISIFFPLDKSEQCAIAAALLDADAYIAALGKLIAKKRAVKQGAMQDLLTGKRRLPGFSVSWEDTQIGTLSDISSGGTPNTATASYWGGYIPWMNSGELNLKIVRNVQGRITPAGMESSSTHMIPAFCVLIGLAGQGKTRGTAAYNLFSLCTNQSIAAIYPSSDKFDSKFLYYLLDSKYDELRDLSSGGGGRGGLTKKLLLEYSIYIPTEPKEQTAIAEILSDMDAGIDALTAKLNKAKHIKHGMMSELLTGRIRLVEQEAPAEDVAAPKIVEMPKPEAKGHNQQFDDAVMIAGIVNALYSDKYPLGRKKVQKCLYLLRRYQDEGTNEFKKKAAGPYADEVRYKGGEPVAKNAHYIDTTVVKDKGTTFARGKNINQALTYISAWDKQGDIKWISDNLKFKKVDELELLATVDMAICDLTEAGTPVTVTSIKHLIATNAEWKAKLNRQTFSDANIAHTIKELQTLLQGGN